MYQWDRRWFCLYVGTGEQTEFPCFLGQLPCMARIVGNITIAQLRFSSWDLHLVKAFSLLLVPGARPSMAVQSMDQERCRHVVVVIESEQALCDQIVGLQFWVPIELVLGRSSLEVNFREPLKTAVFIQCPAVFARNFRICPFFEQIHLFPGLFVPHSSRIGPLQAHLGL